MPFSMILLLANSSFVFILLLLPLLFFTSFSSLILLSVVLSSLCSSVLPAAVSSQCFSFLPASIFCCSLFPDSLSAFFCCPCHSLLRADLSSPSSHCTLILLCFSLSCFLLPYLSAVLLCCLWKAGLHQSVAGSCIFNPGRGPVCALNLWSPVSGFVFLKTKLVQCAVYSRLLLGPMLNTRDRQNVPSGMTRNLESCFWDCQRCCLTVLWLCPCASDLSCVCVYD